MAEQRRCKTPEIPVEITADTAEIDAAWGVEDLSRASATLPKPARALEKKLPPVAPPRPNAHPPPSGQRHVSREEDDPIEFEADVAPDSIPTLPDPNPLQYDVVPENERVTIPPAPRVPRVPALPRRRRKRE